MAARLSPTTPRLLRRRDFSTATQAEREVFVYLPAGHGDDPGRRWPVRIFHGGRDPVVKVEWSYTMAAALEAAGHTRVHLTVHEDLGHDAWGRVHAGEDLHRWLLAQQRATVRDEN